MYQFLDIKMKKIIKDKKKIAIKNCEYIQLVKSGINEFNNKKIYLDTSCVSFNSIIDESYEISFNERPSRANMQPSPDTVWFAKLKDSPKHIIVKEFSKDILENKILSTGFLGLKIQKEKFNLLAIYFISDIFDKEKNSLSIGATMQSINNDTINNMEIPNFDCNDFDEFNKISDCILKTIYNISRENQKLNKLKQQNLFKFF